MIKKILIVICLSLFIMNSRANSISWEQNDIIQPVGAASIPVDLTITPSNTGTDYFHIITIGHPSENADFDTAGTYDATTEVTFYEYVMVEGVKTPEVIDSLAVTLIWTAVKLESITCKYDFAEEGQTITKDMCTISTSPSGYSEESLSFITIEDVTIADSSTNEIKAECGSAPAVTCNVIGYTKTGKWTSVNVHSPGSFVIEFKAEASHGAQLKASAAGPYTDGDEKEGTSSLTGKIEVVMPGDGGSV